MRIMLFRWHNRIFNFKIIRLYRKFIRFLLTFMTLSANFSDHITFTLISRPFASITFILSTRPQLPPLSLKPYSRLPNIWLSIHLPTWRIRIRCRRFGILPRQTSAVLTLLAHSFQLIMDVRVVAVDVTIEVLVGDVDVDEVCEVCLGYIWVCEDLFSHFGYNIYGCLILFIYNLLFYSY